MKEPEGFSLYYDRLRPMKALPDDDLGKVFRAIWQYAEAGTVPDLPPHLMMAWEMLRPNIDDGIIRYNERCIKNKHTAFSREWRKKHKDNEPPPDIWEWWAEQPDYTPDLFKKETWHDEAAAEHGKLVITPVNECAQSLTETTNPSTYPIPGPGPNPSPGPGNNTPIGNNKGADRLFQLADKMKRENIEQRIKGRG